MKCILDTHQIYLGCSKTLYGLLLPEPMWFKGKTTDTHPGPSLGKYNFYNECIPVQTKFKSFSCISGHMSTVKLSINFRYICTYAIGLPYELT